MLIEVNTTLLIKILCPEYYSWANFYLELVEINLCGKIFANTFMVE
jgi:hypothetical protein